MANYFDDLIKDYPSEQVIHEPGQVITPNDLKVGKVYRKMSINSLDHKINTEYIAITKLDFDRRLLIYHKVIQLEEHNDFDFFTDMGLLPYSNNNKWNPLNWLVEKKDD